MAPWVGASAPRPGDYAAVRRVRVRCAGWRPEQVLRRRHEEQAVPPAPSRRAALLEAIAPDLLVLLLGGILCWLGVAATLHVLGERHRTLELHSSGLTTTATVKKVDDELHPIATRAGGGSYTTQEVDVEFSDRHGRRHSATLDGALTRDFVGRGYEGYRTGNEVVLVYDRNDPDYADFADPCLGARYACDSGDLGSTKLVTNLLLPFVGVVIGISCLVGGGLLLASPRAEQNIPL